MSNEALLIVDMQELFLSDKNPSELKRVLKIQREMIEHFMLMSLPFFYLAYLSGDKVSPIDSSIRPPQILRLPVVYKEFDDGFKETELDERLQKLEVKKLHITGCNVDQCVKVTVQSAITSGYKIILYPEALLALKSNPIEHHKAIFETWKDEEAKGVVSVASWSARKRE